MRAHVTTGVTTEGVMTVATTTGVTTGVTTEATTTGTVNVLLNRVDLNAVDSGRHETLDGTAASCFSFVPLFLFLLSAHPCLRVLLFQSFAFCRVFSITAGVAAVAAAGTTTVTDGKED